MSEEVQTQEVSAPSSDGRRRRRRRRRRREEPGEAQARGGAEGDNQSSDSSRRRRGRRSRGGGNKDVPGEEISLPTSGQRSRRRRKRRRRGAPVSGIARRRQLSRSQIEELSEYFSRMPEDLLYCLYRGLGGQPDRVPEIDRVIQLTLRAVTQSKRMSNTLRAMHERERTALAILIQCGGLAHSEEFLRELPLSLGGSGREWQKVLQTLASKGLIYASDTQEGEFFYMIPEPLVEFLLPCLDAELAVPIFQHPDVQVRNERAFSPPLDFSVTTLCTYISQRPPRLTQKQEIFKVHKDEMDEFFGQLWDPGSDLFHFHIDFLMLHGLVELHGDTIMVNREVVEEWLNLDRQDQRDLIFSALDKQFSYAEWVMWAVHSGKGEWVPERPLSALYRRWNRGEDWRTRLHKGEFTATRSSERESWSFAPLVNCGMLELGEWGQEKFYRLTPRAKAMLEPTEDEGFTAFYLTPAFEIMAPAGLAPLLLFRIGEIAELTGCDRANTYKVTEISVEQALQKSWKRDDLLDFLRDNSQTGLPENVEQTLRGWVGHHGDVEFHDVMLLTVHKSRIRKLEATREIKPFLLHRFVPGMYAVDRNRLGEIRELLGDCGFNPSSETIPYPGSPEQASARERLMALVAEAREASQDPLARAHAADTLPEDLQAVPGAQVSRSQPRKRKKDQPPRVSPREARLIVNQSILSGQTLEVLYLAKDGKRVTCSVAPERLAVSPAGDEVMVALDLKKDERRTYKLAQIERMRAVET